MTAQLHCHDCRTEPGERHRSGCDAEQCALCGGQLIDIEPWDLEAPHDTRHLEHGMRGWSRAWRRLRTIFGSTTCKCPETHEVWQYMGSSRQLPELRWRHCFRHRSLPEGRTNMPGLSGRIYVDVHGDDADFEIATKLTLAQRRELSRLNREPQPTYGAARTRVQNRLVAMGLAAYPEDSAASDYGSSSWCTITDAGRHRLETDTANRRRACS